jgi:O-antigen/teichoic acid export membrane protein
VRVGGWALKLADRLVLQKFLPLSVVGLYSVGYSLGSMPFELIASATAAAILPFFYRTATEESEHASKAIFATVAAYDAALFGFLGLGTILFAREVIVLFATSEYLGARPRAGPRDLPGEADGSPRDRLPCARPAQCWA